MDFTKLEWEIINEEDGGNLLKFTVFVDMALHLPKKIFGQSFSIALELREGHIRYAPEKQYEIWAQLLLDRFLKDEIFFLRCVHETEKHGKTLLAFSKSIHEQIFCELSHGTINSLFQKWFLLYQKLIDWGMLLVYPDMGTAFLTKEAFLGIEEFLKNKKNDFSASEIFVGLSTPIYQSSIWEEEISLLRLAKYACEKNINLENFHNSEFTEKIIMHLKNFEWVYYAYEGPIMKKEDVLERIAKHLQTNDVDEKLKEHESNIDQLKSKQQYWEKYLDFSPRTQSLIKIARALMLAKAQRKDAMTRSFYLIHPFLEEIAKRVDISWKELHHLLPWELEDLLGGKISKEILKERYKHCVYFTGGTLFVGQKAKKFSPFLEPKIFETNEIHGQCACQGSAKGKVKIINISSDMAKMEEGDILVSSATIPEIVPAMKKAAAIVTDVGGITSHAAIISRELRIPCIIGTKIATKILKDGDLVFVDANFGIVRRVSL